MKHVLAVAALFFAIGCALPERSVALSDSHSAGVGAKSNSSGSEVGSLAPLFTLDAVVDLEFKKISLADYRGKWVVLFFYPKADTPG